MPIIEIASRYVGLCASVEYLDMRPLQTLEVLLFDNFLEGLTHEEGVPFLWGTIGAILLSVGPRDVYFFLGAWKWSHFQCRGSNVFWTDKQDLKVLLGELWVEIHNLGEVDQANLESRLG